MERLAIRERVVLLFTQIDEDFAAEVAHAIGVSFPVTGKKIDAQHLGTAAARKRTSPALSLLKAGKASVHTRRVAVLAASGVSADELDAARLHLEGKGAILEVISLGLGTIPSAEGRLVPVDRLLLTVSSVLYDAVYIPAGKQSVETLLEVPELLDFVDLAYRHGKPIGASNEGLDFLAGIWPSEPSNKNASKKPSVEQGVVTARSAVLEPFFAALIDAMETHRHCDRGTFDKGAQAAPRRGTS